MCYLRCGHASAQATTSETQQRAGPPGSIFVGALQDLSLPAALDPHGRWDPSAIRKARHPHTRWVLLDGPNRGID